MSSTPGLPSAALRLRFQVALGDLVRINKELRRYPPLSYTVDELYEYHRNFCTVRVDAGQLLGKTYFVQQNATSRDLVVIHKVEQHDFPDSGGANPTVVCWDSLPDLAVPVEPFHTIYVTELWDGFALLHLLYRKFGKSVDQTFVILGTMSLTEIYPST